MPLTLRFGERGLRKQWALEGTDTTPFLSPPPGLAPVPGTLAFGPFTEPFGIPPSGVDYAFDAGTARDVFGIRAGRGSLDNVQAVSAEAESITLVGFKHADVDVGRAASGDSAVTLIGTKQGNVATGAGDDSVEIAMLRVGGPAEAAFRISTGAGDDTVTLRGLDAAEIAGDPTFARLLSRFGTSLPSGEGQESYVDLGTGNDRFTGHTSADSVLGGYGQDALAGGGGDDVLDGDADDLPDPTGTPVVVDPDDDDGLNNALVDGLGGTNGFGENTLFRNDDGSSARIDLTPVFGASGFDFFGQAITGCYVNTNGNITFAGPLASFTPSQIGAGTNFPIIAPFWADVDTRGGDPPGITAGGTSTGSNNVFWDLDAANGVFTVTWDDVGFFPGSISLLNAFQLQLISEGDGDVQIIFRYEAINWTTGGASGGTGGLGGTPARAGYTNADESALFELPASGNQAAVLDLDIAPGNTGIAGVWVFRVRDGEVTVITAEDDTLDGGAGDDTLDGGFGNDLLTGGAGADIFRFEPELGTDDFGDDIVTDFDAAEGDRIDLSDFALSFAEITALATIADGDTIIGIPVLGETSTIRLEGVTTIAAADFILG